MDGAFNCSIFMEKIALAMIVKNDSELDILKRAITSIKDHVQGVFITGTQEPQYKIKKYYKISY